MLAVGGQTQTLLGPATSHTARPGKTPAGPMSRGAKARGPPGSTRPGRTRGRWAISAPTSASSPVPVRRAVLDAYERLGGDVPVTVRVSATANDTAPTSFAGIDKTFTNVRGGLELVDRIVECWAARWSPQVVAYRAARAIADEPAMTVVVQPMVDTRMPGATVTAGPRRRPPSPPAREVL